MAELQAGARLQQGFMGIAVVQAVDSGEAGVTVGQVEAGSGAAAAGDIIIALDGAPINSYASLVDAIGGKQPGETVTVTIVRDGQKQEAEVTLG